MQFSNPIWLWSLAALVIPVAIHLLSRKEGAVIEIGSIRFLRESPTAKFRHIRLNEVALLMLRCLLIILLVFLLAGITAPWSGADKKWVVLDEGMLDLPRVVPLLANLHDRGYEIRLMADGFPLAADTRHQDFIPDYWAAVSALASKPLDSVVVISYDYQRKFKGERVAMPSHMSWISLDVPEEEFIARQFRMGSDSVWVRKGFTTSSVTRYETQKQRIAAANDTLTFSDRQEVAIVLVRGDAFNADYKILRAALEAIQSVTPHKINVTTVHVSEWNSTAADFIFWLSDEHPPALQRTITIIVDDCSGAIPLIVRAEQVSYNCNDTENATWIITRRLNEGNALEENFTLELAKIILPPAADELHDHRVIPEQMLWSSGNTTSAGVVKNNSGRSIDQLLVALFLLTLVCERLVAYKRNQ